MSLSVSNSEVTLRPRNNRGIGAGRARHVSPGTGGGGGVLKHRAEIGPTNNQWSTWGGAWSGRKQTRGEDELNGPARRGTAKVAQHHTVNPEITPVHIGDLQRIGGGA